MEQNYMNVAFSPCGRMANFVVIFSSITVIGQGTSPSPSFYRTIFGTAALRISFINSSKYIIFIIWYIPHKPLDILGSWMSI